MVKKFRRSKKPHKLSHSNKASAWSDEERKAYLKIIFSLVFIIAVAVIIYLKGVDFIAYYGSLWRSSSPSPTPASSDDTQPTLPTPLVDPLPSAVKEDTELVVKGTTFRSTQALIFVNDQQVKTVETSAQGDFTAKLKEELQEGDNLIQVASSNLSGEISKRSPRQTVLLDTKPPQLEIFRPKNNELIEKEENVIRVEGLTDSPKNLVTVNGYRAIVNPQGNFSTAIQLTEGDNTITIKAEDPVGHLKEETVLVKFSPPQEESD